MAGVTIDHMVSVISLMAVLLIAMGLYNQMFYAAVAYQRHHQIAMKAVDLIDNICLSDGYWEESNCLAFGLHQPSAAGYSLSPFAIQRLLASGELVNYTRTGMLFSNISLGESGSLLVPVDECVNYSTAAMLLGVNQSYGFQLSIKPTLKVSIIEVEDKPLKLEVKVRGPGLVLSSATLAYHFFLVNKTEGSDFPSVRISSGAARSNSTGSAFLEFDGVDGSNDAYSIIVSAYLGGLFGIGYKSHETIETGEGIVPFVLSYNEGKIMLAHSWDVHQSEGPESAVFYNATFLVLTEDYELKPVQIANSTAKVVYGKGHPYNTTQIPTDNPGILLVTYRTQGNRFGTVIMLWGINTLGPSVTFGGDPSNQDWVATDLRQVMVGSLSYQVKISVWSLKGGQVWGG